MLDVTRIELDFPVEDNGQKVTELNMRRCKVADQMAVAKLSDSEMEITLFANLCMVSPDFIGKLDMADYMQIQTVYKGFLSGKKKKSSGESSQ